ncbi:universal stress protein [Williamsia deligens]|uniref:Universal stress protein n=1 Tax=Williamsia deligens TaxID=321325 RepID=A0ABW3GCZ3_9NOCA|nr:universal stress protein [Williamsia deligens]MCP2192333.1 Nucleotide-binding universal stress protein, UspA family [Williamsia deligens]
MSPDATRDRAHVVVGYLATPSGADGVELGVSLAQALGAVLDLVCVVREEEPDGTPGRAPYQQLLVERAHRWLADGERIVAGRVPVATHAPVAESFTGGLLDTATSLGATMIVVGGTRDGIIGRHSLGSISSELLHCASLPVALAPRGHADRSDARLATVTVAVPAVRRGDDPLPVATDLARRAGLAMRLVCLVSSDDHTDIDAEASARTRTRQIAAAQAALDDARARLGTGAEIDALVGDGDTLEAAVASLRFGDSDLLVVGSSRLGPPSRVFLGSTASRILRSTTAPILVVPNSGDA